MNIELGHAQSGNFELHCVKGLAIHGIVELWQRVAGHTALRVIHIVWPLLQFHVVDGTRDAIFLGLLATATVHVKECTVRDLH